MFNIENMAVALNDQRRKIHPIHFGLTKVWPRQGGGGRDGDDTEAAGPDWPSAKAMRWGADKERVEVFSHCWSAGRPGPRSGRRIWSGSRSRGGRSRRQTWSCGRCHRWARRPSAESAGAASPPRCDAPPVCSSQTAGAASCDKVAWRKKKSCHYCVFSVVTVLTTWWFPSLRMHKHKQFRCYVCACLWSSPGKN